MAQIYGNITELIGKTPLLHLGRLGQAYGCRASVYGKLECFNPGGSLKDRAALQMVTAAMQRGELPEGGVVVEPTGGNCGVALSMVCAALGLRCILVVPEDMDPLRVENMRTYGAEIVMTPAAEGAVGAAEKARAIRDSTPGCFMPMQFENDDNCEAHRRGTGLEIVEALGQVDFLVAGVGSGGSLTGCGEVIKAHCPDCRIVAVEPVDSPVISGGFPGGHGIPGIGAGFIPPILNEYILDEVMRARTPDSLLMVRELARLEGVLCGPSSGAALAAAVSIAQREENSGKRVVVILPDNGEVYLQRSTP